MYRNMRVVTYVPPVTCRIEDNCVESTSNLRIKNTYEGKKLTLTLNVCPVIFTLAG